VGGERGEKAPRRVALNQFLVIIFLQNRIKQNEYQAMMTEETPSTSTYNHGSDPDFSQPERHTKKTSHITLNAPRDILSSQKIQEETVRCGLSLAQTVALVSAFIITCNGNVTDFVLSVPTEKRRKSSAIASMAGEIHRWIPHSEIAIKMTNVIKNQVHHGHS
jgi:hypothetical protein